LARAPVEQRADIRDLRTARKHQGERACDLGHRAKIALAHHLHLKSILEATGVSNHTDDRLPSHNPSQIVCLWSKSCLCRGAGSTYCDHF
jgi:hypothetical protein